MSEIGKLIQAYQDRHGTSDRALALRVGVTATLVGRWKKGHFVELPKPDKIHNLAELMRPDITEEDILNAFLADAGYREEVMGNAEHPAPTKHDREVTPLRRSQLSDDSSNLGTPSPRVAKKRPSQKARKGDH